MSEMIQWPRAKYWETQWNPWIGCEKCSDACLQCWAEAWAKRFNHPFAPHRSKKEYPPRNGICFCGNLTDLFGEWLEESEILGMMAETARRMEHSARYIWLTKRVARMKRALEHWDGALRRAHVWFSNCWWGFTAENQRYFDERSACANAFPDWANVWMSAEPLLGPIELRGEICKRLKCVIVGCESGGDRCHRRPCNTKWVEGIVEQCVSLGIPVFVKQLDIVGKCVTDVEKFPGHLRIRQLPWATQAKGEAK